jgi:hypothetical protein
VRAERTTQRYDWGVTGTRFGTSLPFLATSSSVVLGQSGHSDWIQRRGCGENVPRITRIDTASMCRQVTDHKPDQKMLYLQPTKELWRYRCAKGDGESEKENLPKGRSQVLISGGKKEASGH